jgi:ferredoxin
MHLRIEPGKTILGRMLDAGMFASHDCQRGECGTCLTRVLDGMPERRPPGRFPGNARLGPPAAGRAPTTVSPVSMVGLMS